MHIFSVLSKNDPLDGIYNIKAKMWIALGQETQDYTLPPYKVTRNFIRELAH